MRTKTPKQLHEQWFRIKYLRNMEHKRITPEDWKRIYQTMCKYNRTCGYVDYLPGTDLLTFWDSDPRIEGVGACFVTIDDVKDYMTD